MVKGNRCWTIFANLCAIGVLGLGTGCQQAGSAPAGEPVVLAQSAATPAVAAASPAETTATTTQGTATELDVLFNAMHAATARRSFRAKVEAEVDGEKSGFELEFVAPDRYRMKSASFEFIIIGQDGYLKLDNQWQKAQRDETDTSNTFNVGNSPVFWSDAAIPKLKPHLTLKAVRATTLAGLPAQLVEYEMTDALGRKGHNQSRTWVGQDGLPRRTEMTGEYDGVKSHAVMTWLDYDSSLKIAPPPAL